MPRINVELNEEEKEKILEDKREGGFYKRAGIGKETLRHYFLRKSAESLGLYCPNCNGGVWRIRELENGFAHIDAGTCGRRLPRSWVEENKEKLIVVGEDN